MRRIAHLREYARRLTRALRMIWQSLESRVEKFINEGCPYPPAQIAESVVTGLIDWEFRL